MAINGVWAVTAPGSYMYMYMYMYMYPGGKVRVISLEALARGDIARSRQIPWLHVCLREMMKWREAAGLCTISRAYN